MWCKYGPVDEYNLFVIRLEPERTERYCSDTAAIIIIIVSVIMMMVTMFIIIIIVMMLIVIERIITTLTLTSPTLN